MELAYAYTTIASGGIRFDPFPLFSVTTADGDILMEKKAQRKSVFDPRAAYLTGYAMEGVLERGTASSAKLLGIYFPASGKTGTTDDNRDSWFIGYTPDVVCAVWVGYDSGAKTGLTGASGALHIWARFLRALYPRTGPDGPEPAGGGGDGCDRSRVRVPRHHIMPSNAEGGLPHRNGTEGNVPPTSRFIPVPGGHPP